MRSLAGECWIDRESGGCEFRDARLGDSSVNCSRRLEAPWDNIPLVCQDWANTKADRRRNGRGRRQRAPSHRNQRQQRRS
ncbi:hypothetical protein HCN50_28240 [Bradyrhizobium sp. WSM 1744]|uniref:Transposase Tn5-like N-terminal domain-containing protein n=1 Tax=Bradyrhizobium archetypum TaxID=2721160 RepID=A0A7Y4H9F0_9BRAD|nr:hypothetical protein [Bradyrhizobium archetypum]